MSKLGRLTESARDRAIQIIDSGADLRRWEEAGTTEINRRKNHLAKLRDNLLGVRLPGRTGETFAAWNAMSIHGHACFRRDFP